MRGNSELARWIEDQIGPGKSFRSLRDFALEAGFNENTVAKIQERGRARPETLVRLAKAARRPYVEVPGLDGFVEPTAIPSWLRAPEAEEAARVVDEAAPEIRVVLLEGLKGIARSLQQPEYLSRVKTHLQVTERQEDAESESP